MTESTTVRENLMSQLGYTPYCGNPICRHEPRGCSNPRTVWGKLLDQFICPECGWISAFPEDFIKRYKEQWGIK